MAAEWLLTIVIFAPVVTGLLTLFLPKHLLTARVLLAAAGPTLSFALLLTQIGLYGVAERPQTGVYAQAAHAAHETDHHGKPAAGQTGEGAPEGAPGAHDESHDAAAQGDEAPAAAENVDAAAPVVSPGTEAIPWLPSLHINLAYLPDGLGLFYAMLVSGIGLLIVLYARGYFGTDQDELARFYPTLGFFASSMIGIVLADYMLLTVLFWEGTSISSFLLIGWDRYDKKAVKLAMQAFFTTGLGGMAVFGGVLLFGMHTQGLGIGPVDAATGEAMGIWRWSDLYIHAGSVPWEHSQLIWAFVLMFLGMATKSAQWPWHYWLPGAMAAPTPVSAFLHSATMVKAGVFLAGRVFPVMAAMAIWPWLIVPVGGATMLLGALIAINQHDLKRIFAYTTVSQLGLLMCMYGLGSLTYHGAPVIDFDITQTANHAFYKAALFITAGAIGHYVSRDITQLNGAFYKQPWICGTMIAAGYALAALPGTISFPAKELFLYAVYHAIDVHPVFWVLMLMTVLTAVCNVAIFIRLTTTLLGLPGGMTAEMGHAHDDHHQEHEHEHGLWAHMMWLPAAVLVAFQFIGGIATPLWNSVFLPLEHNAFYEGFKGYVPALWDVKPGIPLLMSVLAIVGGVALGYSRLMRGAIVDVHDKIYPAMYWLFVTGGGRAFRVVQTGYLRHYLMLVLVTFLFMFFWVTSDRMFEPLWRELPHTFEFWPGVLLGAIICVTSLALPPTRSRVVRVLLLGACGFTVVGMYLTYQAPDLALTQLMVEIIAVILFVMVLRLLPYQKVRPAMGNWWRFPLSITAGLVFGWMTIVAASGERPDDRYDLLGQVFAQNSKHVYETPEGAAMSIDTQGEPRGGGGKNIVNVILVDFRGFDTLGEITVLALAAMGVWSLVPSRRARDRGDGQANAPGAGGAA